jgi:hypothetical protein
LYRLDYDDVAGQLWFDAYRRVPDDQNIRRGYSAYLARAKRADLAQEVIRGHAIQEKILIPATKRLPESLQEGTAWWKEYFPVDPCSPVMQLGIPVYTPNTPSSNQSMVIDVP